MKQQYTLKVINFPNDAGESLQQLLKQNLTSSLLKFCPRIFFSTSKINYTIQHTKFKTDWHTLDIFNPRVKSLLQCFHYKINSYV